jgi:hypothetical protein
MKYLIAIGLSAAILMTSCTKTYTCACTFVDSAGNTTQHTIGAMNKTKNKAQKSCDEGGNAYKPAYKSVSCHLE